MSGTHEQTFTVPQALDFGVQLHKAGRLTEAEQVYRQILAAVPMQADACHFLGIMMCQLGRTAEALEWVNRAVAADPNHTAAYNNLGNLHKTEGRLLEAEQAYRKVIALDPNSAATHNNLGITLKEQGKLDQAVMCFLRAVELEPNFADAHHNRGNALARQGKDTEAVGAYEAALGIEPDHLEARQQLVKVRSRLGNLDQAQQESQEAEKLKWQRAQELFDKAMEARKKGLRNEAIVYLREAIACHLDFKPAYDALGFILNVLGLQDEAVAVWRQWLEREPGNPVALHMLAAVTGEHIPARASDGFVKTTFDGFAASFDEKLKRLDYRAPDLILEAVGLEIGPSQGQLTILDAGCGTGWCGPGLRPFSRKLIGVDLSKAMLEKARDRGVYDELVEEELTAYIISAPSTFDAIISADTLIYFGQLKVVVEAAACSLRPNGIFAFTLEQSTAEQGTADYVLHGRGRYSHRREYVVSLLESSGLNPVVVQEVTLRMESQKPVAGLLVVARKPACETSGD